MIISRQREDCSLGVEADKVTLIVEAITKERRKLLGVSERSGRGPVTSNDNVNFRPFHVLQA